MDGLGLISVAAASTPVFAWNAEIAVIPEPRAQLIGQIDPKHFPKPMDTASPLGP